ncbi:MAG: hypothetical protein JXR91_02415, partial [Deltaproteobacteria bacterium]|nr:hypothetical protein [Deltaproteobacteria bacterium]
LWLEGCSPDSDLGVIPVNTPISTSIDTTNGSSMYSTGCGEEISGKEVVIAFQLQQQANVELQWKQDGLSDHVFGISKESGDACDASMTGCYDPAGEITGSTTFNRMNPGNYMLIVDAFSPGDEGKVDVTIIAH